MTKPYSEHAIDEFTKIGWMDESGNVLKDAATAELVFNTLTLLSSFSCFGYATGARGRAVRVFAALALKQDLKFLEDDDIVYTWSKFDMLRENVENWAYDRGLIDLQNTKSQLLKTVSEVGELADAELKGEIDNIKDGVGDILVTLIIYCAQIGIPLIDCLETAWDEIKNRKGETRNGTFIKR